MPATGPSSWRVQVDHVWTFVPGFVCTTYLTCVTNTFKNRCFLLSYDNNLARFVQNPMNKVGKTGLSLLGDGFRLIQR